MLLLILLNVKNIFQIAENVLKTYFSREIFCSTTLSSFGLSDTLITWPISDDLSLEVKLQNALAPAKFWSSRVEKVKQVPQTRKVS